MGRKPSKNLKIGDIFHTWEVISEAKNYNYNCKCIECGDEKVINKYALLNNTYALCKKCGVKSILESNIDTILRYWNKDLNGSYTIEEILENPSTIYWFTCSKGHNFRKTIRDFSPESCPTCKKKGLIATSNIKKLKGDTFAKCYPHLLEYWNYRRNKSTPNEVKVDISKRKYWFTCKEGHEFSRTPNEIKKGLWCPFCADNFYVERLRIITQTLMEATFDGVYYAEDDGVIVSPENLIAIYIKPKNEASVDYDTLFHRKVLESKYTKLGYNYIVIESSENLENDIDIMKDIVLNLNC